MISRFLIQDKNKIILLMLVVAFAGALLLGIRKALPIATEVDEPIYVERAVRMASTGDLNPAWFGNPGSTTFYPLALTYRIWNALVYDGNVFSSDPNLQLRFQESPTQFYILGRLLTVLYGAASILLVYKIGYYAFDNRFVAIASSGLAVLYPISFRVFQRVRTDSSGLFFGLLALWLCLLVYKSPTIKRQLLACVAIGLAISSRYFMAALIPAYVAANLFGIVDGHIGENKKKTALLYMVLGLLTIVIVFALTTPFFLFDLSTTLSNLQVEARNTQVGHDGLSATGNLMWYLTYALPHNLTWPQTILAIIGIIAVIRMREVKPLVILVFILAFLIGISISALHWERWIIQILPLFSMFAVYGLYKLWNYIVSKRSLSKTTKTGALITGLLLIFIWPIINGTLATLRNTGPHTRMLTREWILEHLPTGSKIAADPYSADLRDTSFQVYTQSWLPPDRSLDSFIEDGYEYYLQNRGFYESYLADPERYKEQLELYYGISEGSNLLTEIYPSLTNEGSEIHIYKLPSP